MRASYLMIGRIKPVLPSDARNLEQLTRKILKQEVCHQTRFDFDERGNVILPTCPLHSTQYYYGSPEPNIGAVVQEEEVLTRESLVPQRPQGLLLCLLNRILWYTLGAKIEKIESTPWLGVYQRA